MKTNKSAIILALALGVSAISVMAQDQVGPPPADRPPGGEAGPGGPGAPGGRGGFHLLPPRAAEQLNLTADQRKQLAALEAKTKTKLEAILTPEQMQQLSQLRPPMRQGGPGGRGSGNRPGGGNNFPPGPPPNDGDGNNPPPGPPPGGN